MPKVEKKERQIAWGVSLALAAAVFITACIRLWGLPIFDEYVVLALVIALFPSAVLDYIDYRWRRSIDEHLPDLYRAIVQSEKTGMTLTQAVEEASKRRYGPLTAELKRMVAHMSWGKSFEEALQSFGERANTSLTKRSIPLVIEASHSGGRVEKVFDPTGKFVQSTLLAEKERQAQTRPYVAIGGSAGAVRPCPGRSAPAIGLGYNVSGTTLDPSIYYTGRQSTDPLGTMPAGENVIADATTSKTNNERWGDYAAMGIDPEDDCTFWFTSEYSGQQMTRVAALKLDACGCVAFPNPPTVAASIPQDNRIDVTWDDATTPSVGTYLVYRATTSGGPYALIGSVADSNAGSSGGPSYVFHDDAVSGGTRYYYVVKSKDASGLWTLSGVNTFTTVADPNSVAPGTSGTPADGSGTGTAIADEASSFRMPMWAWAAIGVVAALVLGVMVIREV